MPFSGVVLISFLLTLSLWKPYFWCASEKRERSQRGGSKSAKPEAGRALMECLRAGEGKAVIRIWMEPQERGRGEGKEEGRGERRIMAELLTTPWIAKEDFLFHCAGVGIAGATHRHTHTHTPCGHLRARVGRGSRKMPCDVAHRVTAC